MIGLLSFLLLASPAAAQNSSVDIDWPCRQRLVPVLTAETYWSGFPAAVEQTPDPEITALISDVSPRDIPVSEGEVKIVAFAAGTKSQDRPRLLQQIFLGIVKDTNRQRSEVITRLKDIGRRQRQLSNIIATVATEIQGLPPSTRDKDSAVRLAEAVQRREFLTRNLQEIQRTLRYACEVPGELEVRLGAYAADLQGRQ